MMFMVFSSMVYTLEQNNEHLTRKLGSFILINVCEHLPSTDTELEFKLLNLRNISHNDCQNVNITFPTHDSD